MKIRLLCSILFLALLTACGGEEADTSVTEENNTEDTVEEVSDQEEKNEAPITEEEATEKDLEDDAFSTIDPEDAVSWMKLEPGKYAGDTYDEDAVKAEIDKWPKDLEAEEYFHRLLALVAEDYREYQEFIEETEVEFDPITARPDQASDGTVNDVLQPTLHIQILLDASGSMAGQLDGDTKMDLAKEAITEFASELPESANVSLRVYGHKGTNDLDGKEESCSVTEEVYPLSSYDADSFQESLDAFHPTGYTPLALAIEEAGEDLLESHEEGVKSIVYVVSDGEETCGGDPVAAAKELQESDMEAVVNIIGFDIEESEREALEAIADAGAGEYLRADSAKELNDALREERQALISDWYDWVSENVGKNYEQVNEYVSQSYEYESEGMEKSRTEEKRISDLSRYMEELSEDIDGRAIRELNRTRALAIREHMRSELLDVRKEARTEGLERRQNVREEGLEERQKLREADD